MGETDFPKFTRMELPSWSSPLVLPCISLPGLLRWLKSALQRRIGISTIWLRPTMLKEFYGVAMSLSLLLLMFMNASSAKC